VGDYLDVAETVGETSQAPGPLEPAPDAAERRRAVQAEAARERDARRRERAEEIDLEGAIGEAVYVARVVRPDPEDFDDAQRPLAARVARQLDSLVAQVQDAATIAELREVIEDGQTIIKNAKVLRGVIPPELLVPVTPAIEDVTDVANVVHCEGWWCNVCEERFEEPHHKPWSSRERCPECGTLDIKAIEWTEPAPKQPEAPVSLAELSGAEILEQQFRQQKATVVTNAVQMPTRRARPQLQYPPRPFEGIRALLSVPGVIIREREAKTSKPRTSKPAPPALPIVISPRRSRADLNEDARSAAAQKRGDGWGRSGRSLGSGRHDHGRSRERDSLHL
jgi:hypothetical protein